MRIEIIRQSEDGLRQEKWAWWVRDTWSEIKAVFDDYYKSARKTKRHKFVHNAEWHRHAHNNSHTDIPRKDVPMPPDVIAKCRQKIIDSIVIEGEDE